MDEKENTRELVVVDVKRYKKVKKALKESEERFRQLFENVPLGIYRTTPDGRIVDANPALVAMLGYGSFADLASRDLEKQYHDTGNKRSDFIKLLKRDGEIKGLEAVWKRKDGSPIHVRENAKLVRTEDGQVFFEGTVEDITQSKLAEEAKRARILEIEILNRIISKGNLADSLADMLEIVLDCVAGLLAFDTAGIFIYDPEAKKMNLRAFRGGKKKFHLNEKYMAVDNLPFSKVLHGQPVFVDHTLKKLPDLAKQWGWRMASSIPLVSKGRVIGALNAASCRRDAFTPGERSILELIGKEAGTLISKLQTETALRESEKYYRTLIETSPDVIVVMDLEARIITVNQQLLKSGGYYYNEVIGASTYDFVHGSEHRLLAQKTAAFIKNNKVSGSEYLFKKKDGSAIPLEISAAVLHDGQGNPKGIIAIGRDISQRKRGEEELRLSEETFRRTFAAIPSPAYIWKRQADGRILLSNFNLAAEKITHGKIRDYLGIEAEKLYAGNPDLLSKIRLVMTKGTKLSEEVLYHYQSTGESRWLVVDYVRTAPDNVLVITKDVSERKGAEAKLLAYQEQLRALTSELTLIEERERRRIASELHDQIGQNLALCKFKVAALEKDAPQESVKGELSAVRRLLEVSIQDARSLIFDLSPPVLYELGLPAALEWLAEWIGEQYRIPVEFENRAGGKAMESDRQVILFQVVRELLVNVGKHSRASQAKVILSLERESLKIQVNDDGVGFDATRIYDSRGQDGGFGFFSMRERLNYLGGRLEVRSKPGQGSQVTLTMPQELPGKAAGKENE